MAQLDWIIFGSMLCSLLVIAWRCRRHMRSVADFLIVGRKMRKYLGLSTGTAEGIGLVSIVFISEQGFKHGLAYVWLMLAAILVKVPLIGILGFGIRRFRATCVQTLPQYHEMRYSPGVRISMGVVLAVGGILNMAIFPIISAEFLVAFMGLPTTVAISGMEFNSAYLCMVPLIGISLVTALLGGMVSVIVTDYIQSVVLATAIFVITFLIIQHLGFKGIDDSLKTNIGSKAFNIFDKDGGGGYGLAWLIFFVLSRVLSALAFPPSTTKLSATDSTHTARKMLLIQELFTNGRNMMILLWGVGAMAAMGVVAKGSMSDIQWSSFARYETAAFVGEISPMGLVGFCAAGLMFAYITTDNSYYLSWSAIIVNDIVAPLRQKPLSQKQHLRLLRIVMVFIAVFLLAWGFFYKPTESILSYIYLTGAIMTAAGILSFVGLYWKRANTTGAYLAMFFCTVIPLADLIGKQIAAKNSDWEYPLKGHESGLLALGLGFGAMLICGILSKSGLAKWKDYGEDVRLEDQQRRAAKLAARLDQTGPQTPMEN